MPVYFALPSAVTSPAATCAGHRATVDDVGEALDLACTIREDEIALLLGQASFHSLNVLARNLGIGTVRPPACDLGLPISLELICPLPDVKLLCLQVHILLAQSTQLCFTAPAGEPQHRVHPVF
jgi:hypothetical protein